MSVVRALQVNVDIAVGCVEDAALVPTFSTKRGSESIGSLYHMHMQ